MTVSPIDAIAVLVDTGPLIVIAKLFDAVSPLASVTVTVYVTAVLVTNEVPLTVPFEEPMLSPAGSGGEML